MKNILVTGGAGYIGSVLSDLLLRLGYKVTIYDNLMYGQHGLLGLCSNPNLDLIVGDIRNAPLLKQHVEKNDAIIHLACIVGATACDKDPSLACGVNYDSVLDLCKMKSGNQLLIYPTTNSGYGTKSGEVYCTEETPLEPITLYGKLKVQAENHVLSQPNAISLRLATVFGVSPRMRMDLLVNDFVYKAFIDKCLVLFEKDFKRNFVSINDVSNCFVFCLGNGEKMVGDVFNVGNDDENMSKLDLANKIKKHISLLEIYESESGQDPDKRNYIVSSQKLANVGFVANTSVDKGIEDLLKAYKIIGSRKLGNY